MKLLPSEQVSPQIDKPKQMSLKVICLVALTLAGWTTAGIAWVTRPKTVPIVAQPETKSEPAPTNAMSLLQENNSKTTQAIAVAVLRHELELIATRHNDDSAMASTSSWSAFMKVKEKRVQVKYSIFLSYKEEDCTDISHAQKLFAFNWADQDGLAGRLKKELSKVETLALNTQTEFKTDVDASFSVRINFNVGSLHHTVSGTASLDGRILWSTPSVIDLKELRKKP